MPPEFAANGWPTSLFDQGAQTLVAGGGQFPIQPGDLFFQALVGMSQIRGKLVEQAKRVGQTFGFCCC